MLENLRTYFYPNPPREWNADQILKADQLSQPLQRWGTVCKIFGVIGTVFASYRWIASKFKGTMISPSIILLDIASLALNILGIYLSRLAGQHRAGLTKEHRQAVVVDELKKGFNQLPICQSEKELQEKLETDPNLITGIPYQAVNKANQFGVVANPSYRPTKELQPHFDIQPGLTMDQQQDLLDTAYQRGIILHFGDYQKLTEEFPTERFLDVKKYGKYLEPIQQSFICSVNFLVRHLQPLNEAKIDLLNAQLRALSFKWSKWKTQEIKAFNPIIYLEDKDTVVFRGNCSEIKNPIWAIELLAPHVKKIKIQRMGFLSLDHREQYSLKKWYAFYDELNQHFSDKIIFEIDPISNRDDLSDIWQKNAHQQPSLEETTDDIYKDWQRSERIKKAK